MNILITGGAGFIGSHLVDFYLKKGDNVCVIDNLSTGSESNLKPFLNHPNFHFEKDNILDWQGLSEKIAWAHRIYHMAARVGMIQLLANPVETLTENILSCERILRLMNELKSDARLIIASTSEIYGPSDKSQLNENDILLFKSAAHSKWVYAASKFTEEMFALTYAVSKGIRVTLIRFFNTIGPRQNGRYGMVVPRFMTQAMANEPITVYGAGEQTRSFCDVRDTINALDLIANNTSAIGEIINVGQDQPITMNQLASLIKRLAKSDSIIQHLSYKEAYGQDYEDIMYRRPDLTKFNQFTAYKFDWTVEATLLDLVQHHRKAHQD